MRLGQVQQGRQRVAAIFEDSNRARLIPGQGLRDLIVRAEAEGRTLADVAAHLAGPTEEVSGPAMPLDPAEVWACGCTYQQSAAFRDAEHGTREGFYAYVYRSEHRPEVFFKGTSRVCVGPDEPIGIRSDSRFTAPEPELAVVLGASGNILGYTLANDVSAWDIERENPLYLPQSKTFTACCALGPYILTADEVGNPYGLEMTCTITRGSETLFSGSTSTERLNRKFETLVEYLLRANAVPTGSILLTGTGIIVTEESALRAGDVVTIRVPELGELRNTATIV